jgi:hypothetical protein
MRSHPHSGLNFQSKIIALWSAFLLGMLFHTQLALIPLFHGIDVAQSHTHEYLNLSTILWLMLGVFVLPMFAMVLTAFTEAKSYRKLHFGLTIFFTVSNLLHFVMDIFVHVPSYQLFLMAVLLVIGLLLNLVSFQWIREGNRQRYLLKAVR